MMSVDKKDIYWVEYAHKNCHPETCCHPANYKLMKNGYAYDYYDEHGRAIADCDLLNARSESAKPAAPEWDGEGLPPVWCECEFFTTAWRVGRVVCYVEGMHGKQGVVQFDDDWQCFSPDDVPERVRPLRTKEQRQREELLEIIFDAYESGVAVIAEDILSRYNLEPKQ